MRNLQRKFQSYLKIEHACSTSVPFFFFSQKTSLFRVCRIDKTSPCNLRFGRRLFWRPQTHEVLHNCRLMFLLRGAAPRCSGAPHITVKWRWLRRTLIRARRCGNVRLRRGYGNWGRRCRRGDGQLNRPAALLLTKNTQKTKGTFVLVKPWFDMHVVLTKMFLSEMGLKNENH